MMADQTVVLGRISLPYLFNLHSMYQSFRGNQMTFLQPQFCSSVSVQLKNWSYQFPSNKPGLSLIYSRDGSKESILVQLMSSGTQNLSPGDSSSELRERKKSIQSSDPNGSAAPSLSEDDAKKDSATWGRTPDGTGVFIFSSWIKFV